MSAPIHRRYLSKSVSYGSSKLLPIWIVMDVLKIFLILCAPRTFKTQAYLNIFYSHSLLNWQPSKLIKSHQASTPGIYSPEIIEDAHRWMSIPNRNIVKLAYVCIGRNALNFSPKSIYLCQRFEQLRVLSLREQYSLNILRWIGDGRG